MLEFKLDPSDILNRLPHDVRVSIEGSIAAVIYESFVLPADEDYVTARLLAANGLSRAFYWSAAQAIEKYLKGYLLLHSQSVIPLGRGNSHALAELLERAADLDDDFSTLGLSPKADLSKYAGIIGSAKTNTLHEFVQVIEKNGHPSNRYNASGVEYFSLYVHALDTAVALIRGKLTSNSIDENISEIGDDLKRAFYLQNEAFTHALYPSPLESFSKLGSIWSMKSTRLDVLKKNPSFTGFTHALNWLKQRMKT